jgi:cell division protein FtsW (lipid II flippase)
MALEWGMIGLVIAAVLALQLLVVLLRGALSRGRDSFYAAGAAGCLVTAFCETFCDKAFTDTSVQTLTAIIVGLGLSQTRGRQAN